MDFYEKLLRRERLGKLFFRLDLGMSWEILASRYWGIWGVLQGGSKYRVAVKFCHCFKFKLG